MSLFQEGKTYINGKWLEAQSGKRFAVFNPANGEQLAEVPDMATGDVKNAIDAAELAFASWQKTTAKERSAALRRWYELLLEHRQELAELATLECGKPLAESLGEVNYAASFIEWFAEECKRASGDVIPTDQANRRLLTIKQPVGVCAAITPWNFPLAMITRKCAAAMAAGCTVLCKPAEATPLSALALAELASRAGIPAGVFNIITAACGEEVGKELCRNPVIRKLSFTGSTEVGKLLLRQCADTVKKVTLELGGNAPFIVFDDADLDAAVEGALASKYRNTGQTCVCANRFLVQDGIYDEFARKFSEKVASMPMGPGLQEGVRLGPLINAEALAKVDRLVKAAIANGARALTGGESIEASGPFYRATVLVDVNDDMELAREEIFGPVAPLYRFYDEHEAIRQANNTPYGLAAYFYSRDLARCFRVSEALQYGMVGVNTGIVSTELAPFGGVKESGLGKEGGHQGLDEYLEEKYLCIDGIR